MLEEMNENTSFDEKEFDFDDLATSLSQDFDHACILIENKTLFSHLLRMNAGMYAKIVKKIKRIKGADNQVTALIHYFTENFLIQTKSMIFRSVHELANYINVNGLNDEVKNLFKSGALKVILQNELIEDSTINSSLKCLTKIESFYQFDYVFYYFAFNHLTEDLKPVKLNQATIGLDEEFYDYIYENQVAYKEIFNDVLDDDYILGFLAKESSIKLVAKMVKSFSYVDLYTILNKVSQYSYKKFLLEQQSYWIYKNYKNYKYIKKARWVKYRYFFFFLFKGSTFRKLAKKIKRLDKYKDLFHDKYNTNFILNRRTFIKPKSLDYHFGFVNNNEIVAKKYMIENGFFDASKFTKEFVAYQEKEVVFCEIDQKIIKIEQSYKAAKKYCDFYDKSRYRKLLGRLSIYLLLLLVYFLTIVFFKTLNLSGFEKTISVIFAIASFVGIVLNIIFNFKEFRTYLQIRKVRRLKKRNCKRLMYAKKLVDKVEIVKDTTLFSNDVIHEGDVTKEVTVKVDEYSCDRIKLKAKNISYLIALARKLSKTNVTATKKDFQPFKMLFLVTSLYPAILLINSLVFTILKLESNYLWFSSFSIFHFLVFIVYLIFFFLKKANYLVFTLLLILSIAFTIFTI